MTEHNKPMDRPPGPEDSEPPHPPSGASPNRPVARDRDPQPSLQIASAEDISTGVLRLGEAIAAEAVVIGSGAAYMALQGGVRQPRDIDLIVSPEAHAYLRNQPDWEPVTPATSDLLKNGVYEVGTNGWDNLPYEDLRARSWQTADGVKVASLSDVVSWKTWERGTPKDIADVEAIRNRLLDPTKPPLPNNVIADEIAIAWSCLPEDLRDHPDAQVAIELAANGLATVRALYGDDRIGRPNHIVGELELPEYKVVALYHNGFGLPDDMRTLQRRMTNIGASDEQRLEALAADPYTDIEYGNGRKRDNPEGYDELRSANLLGAYAAMKGYESVQVGRYRAIVLGSGFDEQTGTQVGQHDPDPVVRGVSGVDLQVLSEPDGGLAAVDLSIEDGMSARASPDRTLGRAAIEQNVSIGSTEEGLRFVDENPDLRPSIAPEGPTILESTAGRLAGSAGFHEPDTGYTPPDGWTLEDRAMRRQNAANLRRWSARLLAREMTAQEVHREAMAFRDEQARGQ